MPRPRRRTINLHWKIYALVHPKSGKVRYIGGTVHKPGERLRGHISEARTLKTRRDQWISSLLKTGSRPVIQVIENGFGEGMAEAERRWIEHHRKNGARLTNETDGREGCFRGQMLSMEDFLETLRYSSEPDDGWSEFNTDEEDFDPDLIIETVGETTTIRRRMK
jgi:hypothetical protein